MKKDHAELPVVTDEAVINKIYIVRGQKVMLDEDLATLYEISTKRLTEQVKRNAERFPEDFMFQLTRDEYENLRSQFATSSWGGRRYMPYVFTEHGVLMLSSVLNSSKAIQVNIHIMRIFTRIKKMLSDTAELKLDMEQIKSKVGKHDQNLQMIFLYLEELMAAQKEDSIPRTQIGYKLNKSEN